MDKKLNPLDGEIDLLGDTVSDIIRKLNPLTGRLELVYSADTYIQKINPFIGDFDMVGGTGASYIVKEATGNGYINLTNAVANHLMELKAYGGTEQNGTPTPDTPIDIVSNNGAIKIRRQSGLPINYQMVEWIKSTGPIVITDFKTKSTQEITTVLYREAAGSAYLYASDTATSGTTNTTAYLTSGGGNWRWDGRFVSISVPFRTEITSVQSADGVYINDTEYPYANPGEFVSTSDLRISSNENTTIRIYSMTIREGETVTLDLVPVQRLSDSTYGFYDKVSGNFYTNSEATFVAGDTISDPVEIYTDGTTETIWSHGKNLFDPTKVLFGYYRNSTTGGQVQSPYNFMSSDGYYIPCLPNTAYTFVGTNKTNGTYSKYNTIYFFDSAKNYLGASSYKVSQPTTGTTPNNCYYLQIRSNPLDTSPVTIQDAFAQFNWQLELGSTATAYEPYYDGGTATAEMLLKIGDYVDEQEILSGNITRKVGIKVLDGTENWTQISGSSAPFALVVNDFVSLGLTGKVIVYSTHFQGVPASTTWSNYENLISFTTGIGSDNRTFRVRYLSNTKTLEEFKQFLAEQYAQGTPVICVYYKISTTESVTGQTMHIPAGNSTIEITQASIDNLGLYAKYKATS